MVGYKQLSSRDFFSLFLEAANTEEEARSLSTDDIAEIEETTLFLACFLINKQFNKTIEHHLSTGYIQSHDSKDVLILQKINIFFLQRCLKDLKFNQTPEVDFLATKYIIYNKQPNLIDHRLTTR